ncbi:MAG: ABC transporter permease [Flavobacteriales bacterium]|nr:ABC transporter permease [Flavobacteriales bacterium]MCX7650361.1 ABC transporter permease [Flavobacteriales bacterium]MDW8432382.1 ABC transporter permease [Flavobacteriales bacterium]
MIRSFLEHIGSYALLLGRVFRKPGPGRLFYQRVLTEISVAGLNSLSLIFIISLFMGAVISIQLAANIESPLIPKYTVGYASRQSIIYEFSTTVVALILAGKVGSQMASELGSMRISEQVDALEIMGINSAAFLILPKIVGFVIIHPFLVLLSMVIAVFGSYAAVVYTGMIAHEDFVMGLELDFKSFDVVYALVKTVVFAFLIASISSYKGYFVRGGANEVGHASTEAVVASIFAILTSNLIITTLMLL